MTLCIACQNIPWRMPRGKDVEEKAYRDAYARLQATAAGRFMWCDASGRPVEPGRDYWPFIRAQSADCVFCQLAISVVKDPNTRPTYHGGFKLKQKGFYGETWKDKPVWIQLLSRDDRPLVRLWVGEAQPEHFVRTIEPQTTFDSSLSLDWPHVVHQDPFHPDVRTRMTAWLHNCDKLHRLCSQEHLTEPRLPTRILDLDALPSGDTRVMPSGDWREQFRGTQLRLVETDKSDTGKYVALSYCWGSALPCKTTTLNFSTYTEGLSMDQLPKTLQDSIMVTRLLGLRYIWIDCLCIIQDDRDDWDRESALMGHVYSQSYIAIAATCAASCDRGISGLRDRPPNTLIQFKDEKGHLELYFDQRPRGIGVAENFIHNKEPLQRRAWVFQERILAPRTLHFASDQLYWECSDGLSSEDGWGSFDPRNSSFEHSLSHIAQELKQANYRRLGSTKWATLVTSYTALDITYGSDRLPALAGIISALQDMTEDICYAGLWMKHFLNGLLWCIEGAKRLATYRAPSWSFAALDGDVSYFVDLHWHDETTHHVAKLLDCHITPLRNNILGELTGGEAIISAPLTTIEASPDFQYASLVEYWNCAIKMGDGSLREAMARYDVVEEQNVKVLMITTNVGLLIRPVDVHEKLWVRVGILEVYEEMEQEDQFESFQPVLGAQDYPPLQTIRLV